jgi:hypothetical protein
VLDVDQLGRHRLGAREHAQPAEGIDLLVFAQDIGGNRLAADAMEAVGADDVVAIDAMLGAVLAVGDVGRGALEVVRLHVVGLVDHQLAPLFSRAS